MTPVKVLCISVLCALCGCSVSPVVPASAENLWQDRAFEYDAGLVTVTQRSLFELEDATLQRIRADGVRDQSAGARVNYLMTMVFGPQEKNFEYVGGHSTVAAQTWRNRRGDCLSLTLLAYALARALDLPLQMQEVPVPVSFDRRGGVDFLNQHVNAIVHTDRPIRFGGRLLPSGEIVIDFQPQIGSSRRGLPLDESAMLTRYYNNIAGEQLALGDSRRAYAYFKAAATAQPAYAATYSNLAQLYLRAGLATSAERALRHALDLHPRSELALVTLHQMLLSQGRLGEAAIYEQRVIAGRDEDPYYWLGLGVEQIRQQHYAKAVGALQRAQELTSGFTEVHWYLAIAYWRSGKTVLARDQMAILDGLDRTNPKLAALSRKFSRDPGSVQTK